MSTVSLKANKAIFMFPRFARYFGLSLSRGSELHHQHEGQELPPVFTPETEDPMEQAVPQSRQQRWALALGCLVLRKWNDMRRVYVRSDSSCLKCARVQACVWVYCGCEQMVLVHCASMLKWNTKPGRNEITTVFCLILLFVLSLVLCLWISDLYRAL